MPINEQFEEVEENVFRHRLKGIDEEDYTRLLDVAKSYAKNGNQVWILPEIHKNEVEFREKLGLRSETHTPDLWINQKWHVDAKSPHKYSNIIHNANEASKQGGIACVTNHFVDLKESQLNRLKDSILKNNYYQEAEVHFYIDGTLYKYNSQGIILG